jgi:hypothetical protein
VSTQSVDLPPVFVQQAEPGRVSTQSDGGGVDGDWVIQFNANTTADFVDGVCTSEQSQVLDASTGRSVQTLHSMDINCTVEEPKVAQKGQKLSKVKVTASKAQVESIRKAMPTKIDFVQHAVSAQSVDGLPPVFVQQADAPELAQDGEGAQEVNGTLTGGDLQLVGDIGGLELDILEDSDAPELVQQAFNQQGLAPVYERQYAQSAGQVRFRRDRFRRYRRLRIQGDQGRGGLGHRFTV